MELKFEQFSLQCIEQEFECPAGIDTRVPKRLDPICAQCFEAAKGEYGKRRGDVPLLDEMERGPWPSFVQEGHEKLT